MDSEKLSWKIQTILFTLYFLLYIFYFLLLEVPCFLTIFHCSLRTLVVGTSTTFGYTA